MLNVCLGTVQFGTNYGVSNRHGQVSYTESLKIVQDGFERGMVYVDTAQAYGDSERVLGRVFSELSLSHQVQCISKLSPDFQFQQVHGLRESIRGSLERLQIPSLWGLMLHRISAWVLDPDFIEAIELLKQRQMIRHFGVSVYHPEEALRLIQQPHIDIIQVPFNVLDRRLIDNGFFKMAQTLQKPVFVRSLYLQGLLTLNEAHVRQKNMAWAWPALNVLHHYVRVNNLDLNVFVLNALHSLMPNAIPVLGVDSLSQWRENVRDLSVPMASEMYKAWWQRLPSYPVKLLNPAQWENVS